MSSMDNKQAQIARRYSHLFVECDDSEVQHFYFLLSLFFAKCDGLLSAAEVRKLEIAAGGLVTFSPYFTSVHYRESMIAGLEFLKRHNIRKPTEIMRVLTQCMLASRNPRASDRRYLVEFNENPGKPFKWYADRLNVSLSSVTRAYQRLEKTTEFRFNSGVNYPLFRLKHFALFFKPDESFKISMLSTRGFALTLNYDAFGEWKWASFLVPNQDRTLKEFKHGLAGFASEVLRDHRLYEIKSIGKHCNLSMFDGERWWFSEESFGLGVFEHVEANKEVLPRLEEFKYGDKPIRFDQIDFLLSLEAASDYLAKSSKLARILREYGYCDLSRLNISNRLAALKRNGFFFPCCYFSGLGLNSMFVFAAECDDKTLETFYHVFPMLPDVWAYRTDKGVVCALMIPVGMAPAISYVLEGLRDEVDDLIVTSRFGNIGTRGRSDLCKYWNAEKQCWHFERGFFDLSNYASSSSQK
nr:hypothetical protein [Candidatus Njordarchaeota archaeon]